MECLENAGSVCVGGALIEEHGKENHLFPVCCAGRLETRIPLLYPVTDRVYPPPVLCGIEETLPAVVCLYRALGGIVP